MFVEVGSFHLFGTAQHPACEPEDIVVDSIDSPTEIVGIADGKGGLIRKNYSLLDKKKLKIINSWIEK